MISVRFELCLFPGKKEEWSMLSGKFLAKAKCSGFKSILLGKAKILTSDIEIYDKTQEGEIVL